MNKIFKNSNFFCRIAFHRQDKRLLKILLYGIILWLLIEAIFSFYLGIYFNVAVDIPVTILFPFPIIEVLRQIKSINDKSGDSYLNQTKNKTV